MQIELAPRHVTAVIIAVRRWTRTDAFIAVGVYNRAAGMVKKTSMERPHRVAGRHRGAVPIQIRSMSYGCSYAPMSYAAPIIGYGSWILTPASMQGEPLESCSPLTWPKFGFGTCSAGLPLDRFALTVGGA